MFDVLAAVTAALARVLDLAPAAVGPETDLAALGADSLVRVEVAEQVEEALGGALRVTDEWLDAAVTPRELAAGFRALPA